MIHSVGQNILTNHRLFSLTLEDYYNLLEEVRDKITTSNDRKERFLLLILAPLSGPNNQVAILPKIKESYARGRILTEEDIRRIVDFYNFDEYSKQFPGIKNVKIVKQGNKSEIPETITSA